MTTPLTIADLPKLAAAIERFADAPENDRERHDAIAQAEALRAAYHAAIEALEFAAAHNITIRP